MARQFTILIIILLTALVGFGQTDTNFTKADRYKTNKFDVAIFTSSYFDLIGGQKFTPTRVEVDKAELALQNDLEVV